MWTLEKTFGPTAAMGTAPLVIDIDDETREYLEFLLSIQHSTV